MARAATRHRVPRSAPGGPRACRAPPWAARPLFLEAGYPTSRTRIITGRALDVLPRLSDGAYDLVFLDGDREEYAAIVGAALRLLRTGGVLAVSGALAAGRIGDPTARDPG